MYLTFWLLSQRNFSISGLNKEFYFMQTPEALSVKTCELMYFSNNCFIMAHTALTASAAAKGSSYILVLKTETIIT